MRTLGRRLGAQAKAAIPLATTAPTRDGYQSPLVFSVERAMRRFREVERARDPEQIRDLQPWMQVGADEDGNQLLFYERGGRRRLVAQVDEPAAGERDEIGSYSRQLMPDQLEAAGVPVPPLHGRCRSIIVLEE